MLFAIHALDRSGALPTRLANYDAHKAFLSDTSHFGVKIVMSGPLVADDGQTVSFRHHQARCGGCRSSLSCVQVLEVGA